MNSINWASVLYSAIFGGVAGAVLHLIAGHRPQPVKVENDEER
ncbi:MAG TPA: hypothetical protein VHL54_10860 [Actinomycetota bacterium]|nr:hypothetical protein [Actinomycetota bacterium]